MYQANVRLRSVSAYQQGKFHDTPKLQKEQADDFEKRTWKERSHYDSITRKLFIPPMCFVKAIQKAASLLGNKIPGKRNATYTKHFLCGLMATEPMQLDMTVDNLEGQWLFVPANGKSGDGCRVKRCFPTIKEWKGEIKFTILDEVITQPVFEQHLREAGNLVGIGVFRPQNGGFNGRFAVESVDWVEK